MKVTIKDIKEKYHVNKTEEKKFLWTYYVRRPISYYIAWLFLRLGVSANTITFIWLFIGIIGSVFLATGDYIYMIVGALLIEISFILDCVDGHVARFNKPTISGSLLDGWAGGIVSKLSMFTLGVGLSKQSNILILTTMSQYVSSIITNEVFLYLGFLAAFSNLVAWGVKGDWFSIISSHKITSDFRGDVDKDIRVSRKIIIFDNVFHFSGVYAPLMLLLIIVGISDVFLVSLATIFIGYLLVLMFLTIKKVMIVEGVN